MPDFFDLRESILGPIPMANSFTVTPNMRAKRKCPPSCIKIKKPKAKIAKRIVRILITHTSFRVYLSNYAFDNLLRGGLSTGYRLVNVAVGGDSSLYRLFKSFIDDTHDVAEAYPTLEECVYRNLVSGDKA